MSSDEVPGARHFPPHRPRSSLPPQEVVSWQVVSTQPWLRIIFDTPRSSSVATSRRLFSWSPHWPHSGYCCCSAPRRSWWSGCPYSATPDNNLSSNCCLIGWSCCHSCFFVCFFSRISLPGQMAQELHPLEVWKSEAAPLDSAEHQCSCNSYDDWPSASLSTENHWSSHHPVAGKCDQVSGLPMM